MKKILLAILIITILFLGWMYMVPEETTPPAETPMPTVPKEPNITISIEDLTPKERVVDDSFFIGKHVILYNSKRDAWEGVILDIAKTTIYINSTGEYRDFGTDKMKVVQRNPGKKYIGKANIDFVLHKLTVYAYDRESNKYYQLEYPD